MDRIELTAGDAADLVGIDAAIANQKAGLRSMLEEQTKILDRILSKNERDPSLASKSYSVEREGDRLFLALSEEPEKTAPKIAEEREPEPPIRVEGDEKTSPKIGVADIPA